MSSAELIVKMSTLITQKCKEDGLTHNFCDFSKNQGFNQTGKYMKLYQQVNSTTLTDSEIATKSTIEKFMKKVTSSYKVYL